jgi:hypothetical protein
MNNNKNNEIKVGDLVRLEVPEYGIFAEGSYKKVGFLGYLTSEMIRFLKSKENYRVTHVNSRYILLEGSKFNYDINWFKKVNRKDIVEVKFIKNQNETLAIIDNNKVGRTVRNPKDKNNEEIAMIVSLLRALDIEESIENTIIDVLYKEAVGLEFVSNEQLIEELRKRIY